MNDADGNVVLDISSGDPRASEKTFAGEEQMRQEKEEQGYVSTADDGEHLDHLFETDEVFDREPENHAADKWMTADDDKPEQQDADASAKATAILSKRQAAVRVWYDIPVTQQGIRRAKPGDGKTGVKTVIYALRHLAAVKSLFDSDFSVSWDWAIREITKHDPKFYKREKLIYKSKWQDYAVWLMSLSSFDFRSPSTTVHLRTTR